MAGILSLFLLFMLYPISVFAEANEQLPPYSQEIINEVMSNSNAAGTPVALLNNSLSVSPQIVETDEGYAVLFEVIDNYGEKTVTTIIPYKIDDNDELVNSFEYASKQVVNAGIITPAASVEVPSKFVDVTVTVKTYYAQYFSSKHFLNFYRHAGIEAWWSSTNDTASVSSLTVNYETAGELYAYPDVLSGSLDDTKIQNYYYIKSSIVKSNPVKNNVYIDGNNTMPLDRVVLLTDYFDHGGLIYIKLTYKVNNTTRTNDTSYYVYSK